MAPAAPSRRTLAAPLLAIAFCSVVAALSARPGWSYLLFPELAALSTTVLQHPWGPWGRHPLQLVLLPALAAVAGLWIHLHVSSTGVAVLLAVLAAKSLLLLCRSSLAPALSAAALPVILDIRSWAYPLQITIGLVAFTALLLLVQARRPPVRPLPPLLPDRPHWSGMLRWLAYLLPLLLVEHLSGLHTLLLPPLIVISHEGLIEPAHRPWRGRPPWLLPLSFGLAAATGLLMAHGFGHSPGLATALSMAACLLLLRRLQVHLPPVYAMAVLPQLLGDPGPRVLLGVVIGASVLALFDRLLPADAPPDLPPAALT